MTPPGIEFGPPRWQAGGLWSKVNSDHAQFSNAATVTFTSTISLYSVLLQNLLDMFANVNGILTYGILKDRKWYRFVRSRLREFLCDSLSGNADVQQLIFHAAVLLSAVNAHLDLLCRRRTLIYFRSLKLTTSRPILLSPRPIIHSPDNGEFHILHGFKYPCN
jgi:hypothetical protein